LIKEGIGGKGCYSGIGGKGCSKKELVVRVVTLELVVRAAQRIGDMGLLKELVTWGAQRIGDMGLLKEGIGDMGLLKEGIGGKGLLKELVVKGWGGLNPLNAN
jgi:hypothetical protein